MRILEQSEIIQPTTGLVIEPYPIQIHPTHEILGATQDLGAWLFNQLGETPPILFPDYTPKIDDVENIDIQRLPDGEDPYPCVTCAHQSMIDASEKAQWNQLPKQSRRWTAKKSGTVAGRGNSNWNVQQSIINDGMVAEKDYPTNVSTITEYYKTPPDNLPEDFKNAYDVKFYQVPTYDGVKARWADIYFILPYSKIVVSVDGHYSFDSKGRVLRSSQEDTHDVLIWGVVNDQDGQCAIILDSENPKGFVKFAPNYDYHFPCFINLKKRVMRYKIAGNNAVFTLDPIGKNLVPYGSGRVYKAIQSTTNYAGVVEVENLAALEAIAPLADWIITESPWDKTSFVNSLK